MNEVIVYLLAITTAEIVTVFLQPLWGIVAHITILVTVIMRSARSADKPQRQLVLALALVPLTRIVSLSMPLVNIPQMWWYPIMYGPLAIAAVVVMRILGYSRGDVGLKLSSLPVQLAVGLTGFGLGMVEYHILKPEAWVYKFILPELWLPALVLGVSTGFVEEFIFRGVLQRGAWERFGWGGLIYVSVIFAVLHVGFLSWIDIIFVFGVALFFAWIVKRTGSLLGVTLAHASTNITLYLIAPFLF
jgi:membrane protease YdiL (CAAX protease family)